MASNEQSGGVVRKVLGVIAAVVLFFVAINVVSVALNSSRQAENRQQTAEMEAESKQLSDRVIQQLESSDSVKTDEIRDAGDRGVALIERAAQRATGKERTVMLVLADVAREMSSKNTKYAETTDKFFDAGGFAIEASDSKEGLVQRKAILDDLTQQNQQITEMFEQLEQNVMDRLVSNGLTKVEANNHAKVIASQTNANLVLQIREQDARSFEAGKDLFNLGIERWSEWHVDDASGQMVFDNDEDVERFNAAWSTIDDAAAKQIQLQKDVAKRLRSKQR